MPSGFEFEGGPLAQQGFDEFEIDTSLQDSGTFGDTLDTGAGLDVAGDTSFDFQFDSTGFDSTFDADLTGQSFLPSTSPNYAGIQTAEDPYLTPIGQQVNVGDLGGDYYAGVGRVSETNYDALTPAEMETQNPTFWSRAASLFGFGNTMEDAIQTAANASGKPVDDPAVIAAGTRLFMQKDARNTQILLQFGSVIWQAWQASQAREEAAEIRAEEREFAQEQQQQAFENALALAGNNSTGNNNTPGGGVNVPIVG